MGSTISYSNLRRSPRPLVEETQGPCVLENLRYGHLCFQISSKTFIIIRHLLRGNISIFCSVHKDSPRRSNFYGVSDKEGDLST